MDISIYPTIVQWLQSLLLCEPLLILDIMNINGINALQALGMVEQILRARSTKFQFWKNLECNITIYDMS